MKIAIYGNPFPSELHGQVRHLLDMVESRNIGVCIHDQFAAYLAEAVRGGMQAVPKGQYEAAEALGLPYWKTTGLVILPQALKISIPPVVNSFISLFKDTSLVVIIAIYDFAYAVKKSVETDFVWKKYFIEALLFSILIYWIFCFAMSKYSQHLERDLARGHAG